MGRVIAMFIASLLALPLIHATCQQSLGVQQGATSEWDLLFFDGELSTNHKDAESQCVKLGGSLVDIINDSIWQILNQENVPIWARSHMGDFYGGACMLFVNGDTGAYVSSECNESHAFVCQLPKQLCIGSADSPVCSVPLCNPGSAATGSPDAEGEVQPAPVSVLNITKKCNSTSDSAPNNIPVTEGLVGGVTSYDSLVNTIAAGLLENAANGDPFAQALLTSKDTSGQFEQIMLNAEVESILQRNQRVNSNWKRDDSFEKKGQIIYNYLTKRNWTDEDMIEMQKNAFESRDSSQRV